MSGFNIRLFIFVLCVDSCDEKNTLPIFKINPLQNNKSTRQTLISKMETNGNITNGTATKYIILDTDMGSDDAFALQMLLKAEKSLNNIKILAITTVHGNTSLENVLKNTYRLLDGFDRTDVKYSIKSQ